ncbi:hypothetical protein RHODGE_RHODGE_03524 [Rhodoplanes serenus]|uniref:TniQ protein n=1 Tax=Rhodoplanes serenus TaxID=200615 RepID=A0A3S5CYK2_9BRAD|nr:helix-turn-helix domain-containing protein [Rhodoplanes serenus]VCU10335.1 hypothetical protein RHODGE_RHODGE_03524 [Rhodoplanes serenus]
MSVLDTITGRLKIVPPEAVRPFVAHMPAPIPGESLLGFVTRCLACTPTEQTSRGLAFAGIGKLVPFALPTTLADPDRISGLATLLKTDADEIAARLHKPGTLPGVQTEAIDFFGVMIRSEYRELKIRRVAPGALGKGTPFHRALWDIRLFSFDPHTREQLISACPVCGHALGWTRPRGIDVCDRCVNTSGLPNVFLADFPQPLVEVADGEALDFVTGLVDPDPDRKAAARRLLTGPWADLDNSTLFEAVVAFACALTAAPDGPTSTLERPKKLDTYARFTPNVLAGAGRAIIGGDAGFSTIANHVRAIANERPGHYGVRKELGPLYAMAHDQHLPAVVRTLVRDGIERDMARTAEAGVLRRADYARDERWLPAEALAKITGLPRKNLGWLAASGAIPVVTSAEAGLSPRLMKVADVAPLVPLFEDALHEKFAAGMLAVKPEVLPALVERGLIERMEGPVLGLLQAEGPYFRRSTVERVLAAIAARAEEGGPSLPLPRGMRISKAVKRLGIAPVPWDAVIAAIVSGKAAVRQHFGRNRNWLTAVSVADVGRFVEAVTAEIGEAPISADAWIGNQVAAEILGVTEVTVWKLAKAGRLARKGADPLKAFARADVEALAREFVFVPEIVRHAGIARARDVPAWLREHGIEPAFTLEENRGFAFRRERVEVLLDHKPETRA